MANKKGNTTNHKPRNNDSIIKKRIIHIIGLLSDNLGMTEIITNDIVVSWKVGEQQVRKYIDKAWELIEQRELRNVDQKIRRGIIVRDKWAVRAAVKGDLNTARQYLNDRDQLLGIMKTNIQLQGIPENFKDMNPKEQERIRKEIEILYGPKHDNK